MSTWFWKYVSCTSATAWSIKFYNADACGGTEFGSRTTGFGTTASVCAITDELGTANTDFP